MKYITVLDFEVGRVFQYELEVLDNADDNTYERFLSNNGHNLGNCEWMVHNNAEILTQTKEGDVVNRYCFEYKLNTNEDG